MRRSRYWFSFILFTALALALAISVVAQFTVPFATGNRFTPVLIGEWDLNECSGTTALDSSGHGNNGTWSGTAAGNITGTYYDSPAPGQSSSCAGHFNGASGVATADNVTLSSLVTLHGDLSIAAWFQSASFSHGRYLMSNNQASGCCGHLVGVGNSTDISFQPGPTNTDFTVPTMSVNTWYRLMITRQGSVGHVYVDGADSSSGALTVGTADMLLNEFGCYYNCNGGAGSYTAYGKMWKIQFWNYAKSAADALADCQATEGTLGVC